jgi:hypothetical protein
MTKSVKNIIITFIIGCAIFVIGNLISDGFEYKNVNEFLTEFVFYQLYSFVLGYSNMYFFDYMNRLQWRKEERIKRIVIGILGSTGITLIGLFFLRALTAITVNGKSFTDFITNESFKPYQFGLWITLTIVITFYFFYYYNRSQQNKIKEQKVIAGTASAKFDALKNQLDPHFLFNSLNVLTSLIEENPENAQKFTTSLSKVYRYVLEQKNKELVSVDEELEFAKTYMSLLKMRFEDSIIFDIPEKASNPEGKVVPLSLQLLLENAVKHNMVTPTKPLHIKIYEDDGNLVVENNLQPKQIVKRSTGVGLENIKQRYNLLSNKSIFINQQANSFAVSIPILTKQVSNMRTDTSSKIDGSYLRARNHIKQLKEFYYGIVTYCIVIPFLIYINYKTYWGFQWFWFPMFGWGIGIAIQAFKVYVSDGIFGRNWEERKIRQYMNYDKEEDTHWK